MKHARSLAFGLAGLFVATPAFATQYFQVQGGTPLGSVGWTNYLLLADLDGDDDLDVIVPGCTGLFTSPGADAFRIWENSGSASFTDATAGFIGAPLTAAIRVVAVGDIDNDGDIDLYAPSAAGQADRLYVNPGGGGTFADEAATRLGGAASRSGGARFGDFDNDGDLDLIVTGGYPNGVTPLASLYLNDGTGTFAAANEKIPATIGGDVPDDVDLLDVDRDFDLDLLINPHVGVMTLWLNDGSANFSAASPQPPPPVSAGNHYGPGVCDVDGDGDIDLWQDNGGPSYTEQLSINDGNGVFTDQTSSKVSNNDAGADDNQVACVDVDGDGDFDAIVASLSTEERILKNDGAGNFNKVDNDGFSAVGDTTLWIDFGDLNGDGRIDAVTGQGEGNVQEQLYLGTSAVPVDTRAPNIIAVQALPETVGAGAEPVVRFAVSDAATTDIGPHLSRAFVRVTADGSATVEVDARFMGGDLFRAVLPAQSSQGANVTYQVCATDRQDNEGCGRALTYQIEGTTSVGVGGNGAGGAGSGANGSGPGPGAGGSDDDDDQLEVDDDCGCSTPGAPVRSTTAWLLALGSALLLRRRRAS